MKPQEWYMELSGEVVQALAEHYGPIVETAMEETGIEGPDVFHAQTAYSVDPKPLRVDFILERTPYMKESAALARLADSCERGVLAPVADKGYVLTDKGRRFAAEVPRRLSDFLEELEPLPADELERLAKLLYRLVDASLSAAEPVDKPVLTRSRFYDLGPDAPVLERIRRYLNDLNAFRDDVHIASWRHLGVEGYEWEAFSHVWGELVWGEKVTTAAEVAEKLSFRGYEPAEYAATLRASVKRGWLSEEEDAFSVTVMGDQLRREAESKTDAYFYAPWKTTLSDGEVGQLNELLVRLRDGLRKKEAEKVEQAE